MTAIPKVFCFIADKLFQLIKGPAVQIRALLFSQFAPLTNTAKLFYRNRRVSDLFGKFDDAPTYRPSSATPL
ncbi:hypothetical protein IB75_06720 [Nitrosococcus oceani C-27]|uniref:Uncharacterized protein n=1 Tax=Nitrosococcus oceani C-27 TaxID=314279 RepID=A0A0E2ZN29_9GAMM|nr:hypothetical protein IB75_06720 [Nitrosococcus oceani C-27]